MDGSAGSEAANILATRILPVNASAIGKFSFSDPQKSFLGDWDLEPSAASVDFKNLQDAAHELQMTDIPVAFPTETVYGLGADATRSQAVKGIYRAKQRPSDNPLIVHISSLSQIRRLLRPEPLLTNSERAEEDPIPTIYHRLISQYWPGPLTILLPLPDPSPFAPEVTNNLPTVGVRMPSSLLALALIKLSGLPLSAPSANASSKPSPTTAAHVLHDLKGRIYTILDGGPCEVGLESTVVDGLSSPPTILRPGAISIEMLRRFPGWEDVQIGYADGTQSTVPRAPGMKYKHYSPKAKVIITKGEFTNASIRRLISEETKIGIMRTTRPQRSNGFPISNSQPQASSASGAKNANQDSKAKILDIPPKTEATPIPRLTHLDLTSTSASSNSTATITQNREGHQATENIQNDKNLEPNSHHHSHSHSSADPEIWTIDLGADMTAIARNLFAGLRELDLKGVETIYVEGIADDNDEDDHRPQGDLVAAVMNRLKKAAETEVLVLSS